MAEVVSLRSCAFRAIVCCHFRRARSSSSRIQYGIQCSSLCFLPAPSARPRAQQAHGLPIDIEQEADEVAADEVAEEEEEPDEDGFGDMASPDSGDYEGDGGFWEDVDFKAAAALASTLAQLRMSDVGRVVPEIRRWMKEGNEINKCTLIFVMKQLRRRNRLPHAVRVADWMAKEKPVPLDIRDTIRRIDLNGRCGRLLIAEQLFYQLPAKERTENAYNAVLLGYVKEKRLYKAERIFNKLKSEKMITSLYAFNLMASLYRRRGLDEKVLELDREVETFGLKKDICFNNNLLAATYKLDGIAEAELIFHRIRGAQDEKQHIATYVTMAGCYISEDMKDEANAVLSEIRRGMEDGQFLKLRTAYNVLMTMYASLMDAKGLSRTWKEMLELGDARSQDYICMIKALAKIGDVDKAEEIFREAESKSKLKKSPIFGALLYVYSSMQMADRAEELVTRMKKELLVPLDPWCYYHLITLYTGMGNLGKAISVLRESQAAGVLATSFRMKPLAASLGVILNCVAETQDVDLAEGLFEEWKESGNRPSVGLYNKLLKVYVKSGRPAYGFVDRMRADNNKPNEQTEELLHAMKRPKGAQEVLTEEATDEL